MRVMTNPPNGTPAAWRRKHDPLDVNRFHREGWWRDHSLLDDFLVAVKKHPDKAAIVAFSNGRNRPQTLSYGQLGRYVDRCAGGLIELGIQPGDVVSLQLPNGWEFPILALATMRAGGVPNPLPIIYRELELSFMLRHTGSKVLVVPREFRGFSHASLARKLQNDIPTLAHLVCTGGPESGLIDFETFFLDEKRVLEPGLPEALEQRRPGPDDFAVLLFTSGTTGTPKAALHTHNTIWSAGRALPNAINLTADDVHFMASTMGHLTGFYWGMLLPLSMGQKVVYQDAWDAKRLLDAIEAEKITWTLSATPFAIDLIDAQKAQRRPITTLRAFVCGGAQIPPRVATEMKEHLGVDLISLWGATEVGICTIHRIGAPIDTLASSDGMPVPWMELRIVDDQLQPIERHGSGRLQVRGPSIFAGYLNQAQLTADMETPDHWFETGDLGRETPDGGIRISGRSKDIIIRGGQNVPVVEIENELLKHPLIKEVVVVGVPDERLGERGCAVVVPHERPPTLDDIKRQLEKVGMAKAFWPERLEIIAAMPRTPAGKIQKFVLRERLATGKPVGG